LRRQLTADDQFFAASGLEEGFDCGRLLTGPDEIGRGPTAKQQADGSDEDRLAGPCLASQDVEPGI
jgi:hypothetical protein